MTKEDLDEMLQTDDIYFGMLNLASILDCIITLSFDQFS